VWARYAQRCTHVQGITSDAVSLHVMGDARVVSRTSSSVVVAERRDCLKSPQLTRGIGLETSSVGGLNG